MKDKALRVDSRCFCGPEGVYYNQVQDRLFLIKREGTDIITIKNKNAVTLGHNYYYWNDTNFRSEPFIGALTGMEESVRIGDFN